MRLHFFVMAAAGSLASACSSTVSMVQGAGGAGAGVSGTGTGTGTSSGGDPPVCTDPHQRVTIELTLPGGMPAGCAALKAPTGQDKRDLTGTVQPSAAANSVVIDTCPPNADCVPLLATLHVTAEGLKFFPPPPGSFARIRTVANASGGCAEGVLVNEVTSFGGVTNGGAMHRIWLVAAAGQLLIDGAAVNGPALAELPFALERVAEPRCAPMAGASPNGFKPQGVYRLRLTDKATPSSTVLVPMGHLAKGFASGGQSFDVSNLHSANYQAFDDVDFEDLWIAPSLP